MKRKPKKRRESRREWDRRMDELYGPGPMAAVSPPRKPRKRKGKGK